MRMRYVLEADWKRKPSLRCVPKSEGQVSDADPKVGRGKFSKLTSNKRRKKEKRSFGFKACIIPPWPTENMLLPSCNSAFSKFLPKSGGFAGIVPWLLCPCTWIFVIFLIVISNVSLAFFNNYLDFKVVRRQETVPGFINKNFEGLTWNVWCL